MIDTKRNLFEEYNRLPHLLAPPMDDPEYAMEALEWVCEEMDERFGVLRESGARDIASHNRMTDQAPMSNLVICINNYEHLMLEHAMAERFLVRLSAKSARVGISVIIATECPTADVVTRLIKANFTQRICFRTRNCNQSRMLLDDSSAVNLPGQGHVIMMNDDGIQRGFALELPEEDRRHLVDHYVRIHKDDWMEGLE